MIVVVAIVGILLGLLLPMVGGILHTSKLLVCRNNLKSAHQLLTQYASHNAGGLPRFNAYYGSSIFHPKRRGESYELTMGDVLQLKEYGARAEYFFCPFDPEYRAGGMRWNSWTMRTYTASLGYTALVNRRQTWMGPAEGSRDPALVRLAGGQASPVSMFCDEKTPLLADNLRVRQDGIAFGWHHGALFDSTCHTLLRGGQVVFSTWAELDSRGPGLIMGPSSASMWWFWFDNE